MCVWARGGMTLAMTLAVIANTALGSSPPMKTSYACQGSQLELSCPPDHVIKVMRANYGRFSVAICNEAGVTDWSVNCMAPRSLRILQDRCNSENACSIAAESYNFGGDPCPGVPKYLEVYFGCFPETTTSTSTSPNPLPPWLTTKSPISFFPGLLDLDIAPPRPRVPFTLPEEETTLMAANTEQEETTTLLPAVEGSDKVIEEDELLTTTETPTINTTTAERVIMATTTEAVTTKTTGSPRNKHAELVYSSDQGTDSERVRITISTLPPRPPPSVLPHSFPVSSLSMCPPRNIRALTWSWTQTGTEATLSCPLGTSGTASWRCEGGASSPYWATDSPDLSDCQSNWMDKIMKELRKSERILNLASELMQYVSVNALYGGDIKSAINAITIISEKMQYQLESIPTMEQREAMVMELAQSVTKTASALLSDKNLPAWQDLPASQQNRFLSNFIFALERTGSLLPRALGPDKEVSISSDNMLMTVRKISFRNIHRSHFPSAASLATPNWRQYGDRVEVPALVLMENMDSEGSQVVFISLRNLEKIVAPSDREAVNMRQVINSQVIHISFGDDVKPMMREPLSVSFQHIGLVSSSDPQCVLWDSITESWTGDHCSMVTSNITHTTCLCNRLGTYALVERVEQEDRVARMTFVVTVIIAISCSVVVFISIILAFVYCYRIKAYSQLKVRLTQVDIPCFRNNQNKHWSLSDSPTITEDLYQTGSPEPYNNVGNSDFMALSRSALQAHNSPHPTYQPGAKHPQYNLGPQYKMDSQYTPGPQYIKESSVPGPQVHTSHRLHKTSEPYFPQTTSTPHPYITTGPLPSFQVMPYRLASPIPFPGPPSQHIYMEVDPLYCAGHTELHNCSGVHSSSSSQTSSGYSTAPSEHLRPHGSLEQRPEYTTQASHQGGGVFTISQHCPQKHEEQCQYVEPQQQQLF